MIVLGHRGASFDAPENTAAAVIEGLRQGADGVEIDVRLSKDGKMVVIHDAAFLRTTSKRGKVARSLSSKFRNYDAGSFKSPNFKGEKIPFLSEILDIVPAGKIIQIELKSGVRSAGCLRDVIRASSKDPKEIMVIGLDYSSMTLVKELLPEISVAWINGVRSIFMNKMQNIDVMTELVKKAGFDAIDFDARFQIDKNYISALKKNGIGVYSWTVNDPAQARYFMEIGVDGVASDKPGFIKKSLSENGGNASYRLRQ